MAYYITFDCSITRLPLLKLFVVLPVTIISCIKCASLIVVMIALSKDDFHVSKTPPTELVPTASGTSARHVITAVALLDLYATCRTRFRVPASSLSV